MSTSSSPDDTSRPVGMRITSDPDETTVEQPDPGSARERPDLPFRILHVSDLDPQGTPPDWASGTHVHRVDRNTFADLMAEMNPALSIEVANTLSTTPTSWTMDLSFSTLKAFRPEEMARQAEPLASLATLIDLVEAVGAGRLDLDAFRERLDTVGVEMEGIGDLYHHLRHPEAPPEASPSSSGEDDASVDRLLGMVDTGDVDTGDVDTGDTAEPNPEPTPPSNGNASSFTDALMSAVSGDASSAVDLSAVEVLVGKLKKALSEQLAPVLQHPDLRRLEAAWEGLRFLVDRIPFRDGVELVVLPAGADDLHEALHHQVLLPEHAEDREEPPTSLIAIDHAFGREHLEIQQLTDLAGTGASLQTPVVTGVSADFFGIESMSGLAKLPTLRPHLQGEAYVEWNALREDDATQFLGLALPSFLLRGPRRTRNGITVREEDGLLGSGALAVAVAAARSVADTGWPTHFRDHLIDDLPVHAVRGGQTPLAALLPGSKQSELGGAGFIVLGGKADHDAVRVVHASMVQRPDTYDDPAASAEARAHASLPCQLFVARAAHHLLALQNRMEPSGSIEDIRQEVLEATASFLGVPVPEPEPPSSEGSDFEGDPEEGDSEEGNTKDEPASDPTPPVVVDHVTTVDLPDHELLAVRLRPPASILTPSVQLVMGIQVALRD